MWAIEHFDVEPDIVVSGKTLGGGLPLGGVTGRTEIMDAVHPGGLGAMLALELAEPNDRVAKAVTAAARERGLILLSCGLYGNVIRLLPPLSATDEELEKGLSILDEALGG